MKQKTYFQSNKFREGGGGHGGGGGEVVKYLFLKQVIVELLKAKF